MSKASKPNSQPKSATKSFTPKDMSRIMSNTAKNTNGAVSKDSFAARVQHIVAKQNDTN